jgi:hypothetical protein
MVPWHDGCTTPGMGERGTESSDYDQEATIVEDAQLLATAVMDRDREGVPVCRSSASLAACRVTLRRESKPRVVAEACATTRWWAEPTRRHAPLALVHLLALLDGALRLLLRIRAKYWGHT